MLLQFVVENFLSFKDPATLSMLAVPGIDHKERQILRGPGGREVLRCAAVYGPNASGKSNLIKALGFALRLIRVGTKADQATGVIPFKLDRARMDAPSRFEFELCTATQRYSYGFEITNVDVRSEWLFVADKDGEEQILFERRAAGDDSRKVELDIGEAFTANEERRQFLRFVAEGTRRNQLFITEAQERNVTELEPLLSAIFAIEVVWPHSSYRSMVERFEVDASFAGFLNDIMRGAGTGLDGLEIERTEIESGQLPKGLFEIFNNALNDEERLDDELGSMRRSSTGKIEVSQLQGVHRSAEGALIKFGLHEESDGTRRLLHLAPALYLMGKEGERIYVIDELERSLHPLITRLFLTRFLEASSPDARGQLLFTTHDTNLLDLSLLSRDSIWFTEKNAFGASKLYSLADFDPEQLARLGEHLEQGYLQGRFGAIPFFGDPSRLGWTGARERST